MRNYVLGTIINRLSYPSHLKIILGDILKVYHKKFPDRQHLDSAIDWLCISQDNSGCGGCSEAYTFDHGWMPPNPETTGSIITTFLQYALFTNNNYYLNRAIKMGDWEIDIQLPTGAMRGCLGNNDTPIVFSTGMVVLGWASLYKFTKLKRFLDAAIKASDWLISIQDCDGKWSRFTYNDIPNVQSSLVAWSLLDLYNQTNNIRYKESAEKNISWVLTQAKENGWFLWMAFTDEEITSTHTIGNTLIGLLESSLYLEGEIKLKTQNIVTKAALEIMRKYELQKKDPYSLPLFLPGRFNDEWKSDAKFSCLTGNAQIAAIWLKLYLINNDARLLNASLKIIDQLKIMQSLNSSNQGIKGGLKGSFPIWGDYFKFGYPNWAAKFLADALMLQEEIMQSIENKQL
jgi:hypothetical protein